MIGKGKQIRVKILKVSLKGWKKIWRGTNKKAFL
jgi:hypothetical protein